MGSDEGLARNEHREKRPSVANLALHCVAARHGLEQEHCCQTPLRQLRETSLHLLEVRRNLSADLQRPVGLPPTLDAPQAILEPAMAIVNTSA